MQLMRQAAVAAGILISTLLVPALAIALVVWFIVSLVRNSLAPWQFWVGGVVVIVLLQILASLMTHLAERTSRSDAQS